MTTIEAKLKELEDTNSATIQPDKLQAKLIQALREAVVCLEFYATPWGKEHGYAEPTNEVIQTVLNEKSLVARANLKCIENILNGGK